MHEDFAGTERFQVVRRLGAGGMGVVYEALDRERNVRLALKTLRGLGGNDLLLFKREFRALQDVQHPNLISLGELYEDRGRWFFTMELVRGVDIVSYVRPDVLSGTTRIERRSTLITPDDPTVLSPPSERTLLPVPDPRVAISVGPALLDEGRVRATLAQLAQALISLHAAGKIHRDIKPSNILVTEGGRLVLLDFGLVVDVTRDLADAARLAGTIPYMAPESLLCEIGPEADWYAVGVLLYEVLTERLPFEGRPSDVLLRKQRENPPPPRSFAPSISHELEELCLGLLHPNPKQRPTGATVLRRLERTNASVSLAPPPSRDTIFVGRREELASIRSGFDDVREGRTVTVFVHGESGIGKTALVRRFVRELGDDVTLLSGRCYEREAVRYKAVDGVIDALSQVLARMRDDEVASVVPENAGLLPQVFPVLGRITALAEGAVPSPPMEPHVVRAKTFAALKELLGRLSATKPLVLTIDDVQWADPDGIALLADVLRPPDAPRLLLVATCRGESPFELPCEVRSVEVGRLPNEDAIFLATKLVERGAGRADPARVAAEGDGHPMFIDELARHARLPATAINLDHAIRSRVDALPDEARALLEVVSVAGTPIAEDVAAHAALDDRDDFHRCLALLRGAHLVRATAARGEVAIEAVHDRVREVVTASLTEDARRVRAGRVAQALEARSEADPEALAALYHAAGERASAARFSAEAARKAATALAFDRAALLYRRAIDLGGPTVTLLSGLGDALAHAGRGREAATAYRAGAARSEGEEAHVLRRRAAEELLRSGHIDDGLDVLDGVLRDVGLRLPRTPAGALASVLVHRGKLAVRSRLRPGTDSTLIRRFDAAWSVAVGLSLVDVIRASDFQARAMMLALSAGDDDRIARAYALGACFASSEGVSRGHAKEQLARASALATASEDPYTRAWIPLARAMISFNGGEFRDALRDADVARGMFREQCAGASWEETSARSIAFWALGYLGSMRELGRRVEELLREALERGDRYAAINVRTGASHLVRLAADDPHASREESASAIREWSHRGFTLQHVFDLFAQTETLLYEERAQEALALLESRWSDVRRSMMLRSQTVRIFTNDLRGRIELACAVRAGLVGRVRYARRVAARVEALEREDLAWGRAMAAALRAGLAALRGDRAATAQSLDRAVAECRSADLQMNAAAAERTLGILKGDLVMVARANAWMTQEGIANLPRWTRMHIPIIDRAHV